MLTASCLLTTSLDGLEGPPLSLDAGTPDAGTPDAATPDGSAPDSAVSEGGSDANALDGGAGDGPLFDGSIADSDAEDGATKEPIPVASTGDVVRGIAEHGTDVYWVQGGPGAGIVRAPKLGGPAAFVQMAADAFDVAVDDEYVYWSTGKGNEVFRKGSASAAPGAPLFSGARETLYLATGTAGRVYATGWDFVVVGPRGDSGMSLVHYSSQMGSAGIATSASDIFWSSAAGILRGNESGQAPQSVYGNATGEIAGIATDGQEVYWMAPDGAVRALSLGIPVPPPPREVCRASVDGADAEAGARPDGTDGSRVLDVAVDDQWVYFAEPARRRISKCPKR